MSLFTYQDERDVEGFRRLQEQELERIAGERIRKAVAAEREACARIAEAYDNGGYDPDGKHEIAAAIRARGQTT